MEPVVLVLTPRRRSHHGALLGWSILALVYGCDRLTSRQEPTSQRAGETTTIECRADDDCTLLPSAITCCGECDPVPPFEAVPRTAVDALLIELDTRCASRPADCGPLACDIAPPGCQATAACIGGRCTVVQTDACSRLLAVAMRP